MKYRRLGPSLEASVIGFGGAALSGPRSGYGLGAVSDAQARAVLERAFEQGVTLFDTAPAYGGGESERRIGASLSGLPRIRERLCLVSKIRVCGPAGPTHSVDNSPENARRSLEQSLKDLRTDYLDLYLVHWPDARTPIEETVMEMARMRDEKLVRSIGACNLSKEDLERALAVAPIEVVQYDFCALNTTAYRDIFPLCRRHGLGFMSFGTLAKGILAGTVDEKRRFAAGDFRHDHPWVTRQAAVTRPYVRPMLDMAGRRGVTLAQLCVAWVLAREEVSTALCGCKSVAQLDEVIAAAELVLTIEEQSELEALAVEATPHFTRCWTS